MRLIPRDEGFFPLFNELAKHMTTSARLLKQLFDEPHRVDHFVESIKRVEHQADELTHDISLRIDRSFITPFDREDIHNLAQALDTVIDLIDGVAHRAKMFHIRDTRDHARRLADTLVRATEGLEASVQVIRKPAEATQRRRIIKKLEEEGDAIYHEAVGDLFAGSPDPLEVIKWKELYDRLENSVDQCQTAANVLDSIALKNS